MGHYTKLATLGLRCLGVAILAYTLPILVYGALRTVSGPAVATGGAPGLWDALSGWLFYAIGGAVLYALAPTLARRIARDLENV